MEELEHIFKRLHELNHQIGAMMAKIEDVNAKLNNIGNLADQLIAKMQADAAAAASASAQTATDLDGVVSSLTVTETKLNNAVNPPPLVEAPVLGGATA